MYEKLIFLKDKQTTIVHKTTKYLIKGIGRLKFLFVNLLQLTITISILYIWILVTESFIIAPKASNMLGWFLLVILSLLFLCVLASIAYTWYLRIINMGYHSRAFLIIILISILSVGVVGVFLWFWLLLAPSRPRRVLVSVCEEHKLAVI